MIRVTIELISARGRERDRLLGIAEIANVGAAWKTGDDQSKSPRFYRYNCWFSKWAPKERQIWKQQTGVFIDAEIQERLEGEVASFDREARGAWDLLYLALRAVVGSRNP